MIQIGKTQKLTIARKKDHGFYLEDEEENDVLIPLKYTSEGQEVGDVIEVFVYCDSEDWEIATTEKPKLEVNQYALLEVTATTSIGAFCDWGMPKDLLVPFRNQKKKLKTGDKVIVYMYLDELSERLVGTTKYNKHLLKEADQNIQMGDRFEALVESKTDLGYKMILGNTYLGLLHHSDVHKTLRVGDRIIAYVKPIREDGKIDVSLDAVGYQHVDAEAAKILELLKENNGELPYSDKSHPDVIREVFGMSKKLFKKTIGGLYRDKVIQINPQSIVLVTKSTD
jgi:predicted RNA-binding protein (virulence factor B family)